jgi:hypothetical protein
MVKFEKGQGFAVHVFQTHATLGNSQSRVLTYTNNKITVRR